MLPLHTKRSFLLIVLLLITNLSYAQRYALVIGNSNYKIGLLKNPVNDANDMANVLKEKGFKVQTLLNANQREMDKAITQFTNRLHENNAVGLFYYAGHGIEVDGHNYLIPLEANIENETDVKYESVDAGRVMDGMERAGNNLNMVILDACRNNPFARSFRSGSRGLARMDAAKGSLVLYATSPGDIASDGSGRNGLFTQHLLASINKPNLKVEDVFKRTAKLVYQATNGKQIPWQSGVIIDDFYFTIKAPKVDIETTSRPAAKTNSSEILYWESIKNETDPVFFNSYLEQYPTGIFLELAKIKLKKNKLPSLINDPNNTLSNKVHLTVKSKPEDAKVRILNISQQYQEGISLNSGRYHIEVSHVGYKKNLEWVELESEDFIHTVVLEKQPHFVMPLPTLKKGDSWTMEILTAGTTKSIETSTVVEELRYRGREAYKIQTDGDLASTSYISKETMELLEIDMKINDEDKKFIYRYEYPSGQQWPMEIGKRWQVKQYINEGQGQQHSTLIDYEVQAKEKLKLKAGDFDCLKVVSSFEVIVHGMETNSKSSYWWCPEIKYIGKMTSEYVQSELTDYR